MAKRTALLISAVFGVALFAVIWPYQHGMYIGWLHTAVCVMLNAGSCLLFAMMLFQKLLRRSFREDFGIYLWFLVLLGIGHVIFAFMNWGSWVCLALSVPALVLLLRDRLKNA